MMRIFCLLCLMSTLFPMSLRAGVYEGWTMTNFNNENGLPQNSITFIEKDRDGYLWLATQAGIVRYDGQRFRLFDNTNSALQHNRYMRFGQDEHGRIFCLDERYHISYYNNSSGFSEPAYAPSMLAATSKGLIDISNIDMRKLEQDTLSYKYSQRVVSRHFTYQATGAGKGFILLHGTLAGYVSNGKIQRADSLDCHPRIYEAPAGCVGGRLCYISRQRDIVLLDSNGVQSHHKIPVAVPWRKLQLDIPAIAFFQQEDRLLLKLDHDIYEIRLHGNQLTFHHLIKIDIPYVTSVRYYPGQNLLAIGSNTRGLFLFHKKQMESSGVNYANADAFYALAPYGHNQVLSSSGIVPNNRPVPGVFDPLNRYSLLHDHEGNYWYAGRLTLFRIDPHFRILKKIPILQTLKCIQEDERGTVWLKSEDKFGRIVADTFQPYVLDSIAGKTIECFIPAGNQTFWLVGKGLCMWLDVQHHRQRIYHEFDNIELRTAYLDRQGHLWTGSYGQGYFLFRDGRFTKMPEDEAHHLKIVNSFLQDRKGYIWMTTNDGLFQCSVRDLYGYAAGTTRQVYHHYYGKESGLKSSEFNGGCNPSGIVLGDGRFAFPSMQGVVLFNPDSARPELPAGKLFIDQVFLDGMPAKTPELSQLPPSFRRLEFLVSSPYLGNPRNLNIEYNIGGLDDRWYPLNENNRIVLNRLKYGRYTLHLRKTAGFGTANYTTLEMPLFVVPFFYQTWWFRILIVAGLILLVLLIIKMRYRYLIRQRNRLEAEVKERTSELAYHSKLMEKLTLMIAHDLKSPLHFMSKITTHLRHNIAQQNLQHIDRTSSELKNTADQVYQFIDGFNLWASSFNEGFTLNETSFALTGLLEDFKLFFRDMLKANNNLLLIDSGPYTLHTDRELLKIVLRNIIDNANKHNQNCSITIAATTPQPGYVAISITDTGRGMPEGVLQSIRDRIAQASTAASIERNSRLGYQMIIDFATRLSATLDLQSKPGKGTTVTLRIQGQPATPGINKELIQQIVSAG